MRFIIVPGLDGSDHNHWQSTWESDWLPATTRITPASWTQPDLDDWTAAISSAIDLADEPVVLVTHSLGCLADCPLADYRRLPHRSRCLLGRTA